MFRGVIRRLWGTPAPPPAAPPPPTPPPERAATADELAALRRELIRELDGLAEREPGAGPPAAATPRR